jgi:hypothetical protein
VHHHRSIALLLGIALALIAGGQARADSWSPPQRTIYYSPSRSVRVIVTPHFPARPDDRPYVQDASGPSAPDMASAELQSREGRGSWRTRWRGPLRNPVMPVGALVADSGRHFVAFDDWGGTGTGPNVVAIYGADGRLVRSYRLDEFVPAYMVDTFATSVSSLYWQGEGTRIDGDLLRLAIVEPGNHLLATARGFFVDIDLETGSVAPIADSDLARWRPRACELHRLAVASHNGHIERQRAALTGPTSGEQDEREVWESYGYQAASRLYWPNVPLVITLPEAGGELYAMNLRSFRHFLTAPPENPDDRRVFVAASQGTLVAEVERAAAQLRPGRLARLEMTFVADAVHWPRIAAALAASGARLRQVDPAVPLPQHARVLETLPAPRTVDPQCDE